MGDMNRRDAVKMAAATGLIGLVGSVARAQESKATNKPDAAEIRRAVRILGLSLSEQDISRLQAGQEVSLENRPLGEVGEILIRADALAKSLEHGRGEDQPIRSVGDLKAAAHAEKSRGCSGIKVYCWNNNKCCLYLTFIGVCVQCDM